ncbi:MAG: T9SS type A sorting domain-containing protein [Bacteroidales bacterium]|nr:T9SS type A sorting domain-containing protein [Bacteroidales bacterium]
MEDNKTTRQQDGINVSNLHSGVYFVMIKSDSKIIIERFIKQ